MFYLKNLSTFNTKTPDKIATIIKQSNTQGNYIDLSYKNLANLEESEWTMLWNKLNSIGIKQVNLSNNDIDFITENNWNTLLNLIKNYPINCYINPRELSSEKLVTIDIIGGEKFLKQLPAIATPLPRGNYGTFCSF